MLNLVNITCPWVTALKPADDPGAVGKPTRFPYGVRALWVLIKVMMSELNNGGVTAGAVTNVVALIAACRGTGSVCDDVRASGFT